MLSALLIALREGVEASLVVGIILVYLSRTSRQHLTRFVWYGVAAAAALSLAVAVALERWRISEDGFEGLMLLIAAIFVVTMIVWMNRVARHLKKDIEAKVEAYAEKAGSAAGWGIFLFVFLMVLREMLVAFQLALTGLHELSEARWLASSKTEMAILGPIVRNELFFFVFIFGAAALLVLREWLTSSHDKSARETMNDAEKRLLESQNRRQRRWMIAAATASLTVILVLTADFIYARANSAPPSARAIEAVGNIVRVPISEVQDGAMHLYTVKAENQSLRFMIIKNVICRHCASAIYIPSIGDQGGCNPIGVASHVDGGELVIDISSLTQAAKEIPQ